jgi:hypothetical protein
MDFTIVMAKVNLVVRPQLHAKKAGLLSAAKHGRVKVNSGRAARISHHGSNVLWSGRVKPRVIHTQNPRKLRNVSESRSFHFMILDLGRGGCL